MLGAGYKAIRRISRISGSVRDNQQVVRLDRFIAEDVLTGSPLSFDTSLSEKCLPVLSNKGHDGDRYIEKRLGKQANLVKPETIFVIFELILQNLSKTFVFTDRRKFPVHNRPPACHPTAAWTQVL